MLRYYIAICIYFQFALIDCSRRNRLRVPKYDISAIQRKRQETLELCQEYNDEVNLMEHDPDRSMYANRGKREINAEEARRVEGIVDKLYDDLPEKGHYRRKNIQLKNTDTLNVTIKSGRRYNFAPANFTYEEEASKEPKEKGKKTVDKEGWHKRWKHGIVPFFIDSRTYDDALSKIIIRAIDNIEKATCIRMQRLREKPVDPDSMKRVEWLYITNPGGFRQCVHTNEQTKNRGVQVVTFGYDCMSLGDIVHEIMHILGFSHEHTRPDRDEHITILWDNIKPGYKKYFEIRNEDPLMNLPYDHASVMHYPPRAFSKNGQRTIVTEPGIKIGQREGLSETDVEKIGIVYGWECVDRNRQYLLTTCPSVVKTISAAPENVSDSDIESYFKDKLWQFGIVNYKLADNSRFSAEEKENIKTVILHIEKETCIEFRDVSKRQDTKDTAQTPKTSSNISDSDSSASAKDNSDKSVASDAPVVSAQDASSAVESSPENPTDKAVDPSPSRRHTTSLITFTRVFEPGCECPEPGLPAGEKIIDIGDDCFNSVNDLLHLVVHLLGLDHQHNQYDRDSYLYIAWDKINFDVKTDMQEKLPPGASAGYPYDYQSVMHYPWLQIKNGRTNIMYPIWNDGWAMGHWQGLSSIDISKINRIYDKQCSARKEQISKHFKKLKKFLP